MNTNFINITLGDGAVVRAKVAGDGPPLLLLGNMVSWPFWCYQFPAFAQHYRVIAPEYRNEPRSGMRALDTLAADVPDMIRALGHECMLVVGHSIGAMVLAQVLHDTPEVLQAVVLANGFLDLRILPEHAHRVLHRMQPPLASLLRVYPHLPWVVRQLGSFAVLWGGQRIFLHNEPNELKRRMFWGYTMTTDTSMVLRMQAALQYDVPPDLSHAQVPTLVTSSEHDHWMHIGEARRLVARLPCSEHVLVPGVGHMGPMAAPDVFNQLVLRFLSRAEGRVL